MSGCRQIHTQNKENTWGGLTMDLNCIIVIGIICLFQILDIVQLSEIKSIIKGKKK